ncbi:MAG: hypothetical protein JJ992_16170 [Planctomycetes bacterium]|nr:hypothetical protein [Planctomycetota bacterium]
MDRPAMPAFRPDRRGTVGCLWIVGALIGGLVLLVVLGVLGFRAGQTRRAESALAKIRERGEPLDASDLYRMNAIDPDVSDLTDLWVSAIYQLYVPAFRDAGELPIVGTGQTPPPPGQTWSELVTVEQLLVDHAGALALLHQAAGQEGEVRYELDFSRGIGMLLEHVQAARNAASVLALRAYVRAHRGDADGVAQCIHTIHRLSETLRDEPTTVSQLVRISIAGTVTGLVESMLAQVDFSENDLKRLAADIREPRYEDQFKTVLMAERVMGIMVFRDPDSLGADLPPTGLITRDADLLMYLNLTEQAIAIANGPFPQLRNDAARWQGTLASFSRTSGNAALYPITIQMAPYVQGYVDVIARGDAKNDAAATALMIQLYRRRNGCLPKTLKQLVPDFIPAVPMDPIDGKPLRYTIEQHGFAVYSIGTDEVDNGGLANDDSVQDSDVVIRIHDR